MKKLLGALCLVPLLAACAESPNQIEAAYVSPSAFQGRSCNALMIERNDIVQSVNHLTAKQKEAATTDAVAMGVGLFLFWPAILAVGLTDDNAAELAVAKGNYDAITTQMTAQKCKIPAAT